MLDKATLDAGLLIDEAHKRAEQIAGDAYTACGTKSVWSKHWLPFAMLSTVMGTAM
jgi:hypothetical protein